MTYDMRAHKSPESEFFKRYRFELFAPFILALLLPLLVSNNPIFELDQERLLSITALCAEISATFYGLLFPAYTFLNDSLEDVSIGGASNDDVVAAMKHHFQNRLLGLGVVSLIVVVTAVTIMAVGTHVYYSGWMHNWMLNVLPTMSVALMIECILFVHRLADPKSLTNLANDMNGKMMLTDQSSTNKNSGDFLMTYNRLEAFLLWLFDIPREGYGTAYDKKRTRRWASMYDVIGVLRNSSGVDDEVISALIDMKRYRNILAHTTDGRELSSEKMSELESLFKLFTEELYPTEYAAYEEKIKAREHGGPVRPVEKDHLV